MDRANYSADYVIVGAGSAGCVLAARLSADGSRVVTLLEAGGEDSAPEIHQPDRWPLLFDMAESWGYSTTKQPGYNFRTIACPRGKVLGGSSALNAMVYIRGDRADYEHWRDLGNPGWGWDDVKPYFLRSEDQVRGESALHGSGGPLAVSDPVAPHPLSRAFVDAAVNSGHRRTDDFNGEHLDGAGLFQLTQRSGRRCSTATAFLHPARSRANLRTITHARALRLLFDGDRAVGVEYLQGHEVQRVHARVEVIVSAGAIDSPKLLMLSGLGDPAQLARHGIATRVSLPAVGAHLCDHPTATLFLGLPQVDVPPPSSNYAEACLFMRSQQGTPGFSADIQFHVVPFGPPWAAVAGVPRGMGLTVLPCRPASRGSLRLRSGDALDPPVIDPAYLHDPMDLALLIEGLRAARRIAKTDPLVGQVERELMPGPTVIDDASLARAIRSAGYTMWHPVGTCRMGPHDAEGGAVVDAQLRVYGVRGLRVVDASVMPQITSGNTNAPTIMIAEKAAEIIRAETAA